jgi:TIR domain
MAKSDSHGIRENPRPTAAGRAPITPLDARKVVFISHANPEDNAVTAWYGARLAGAGYEVWTDLTRLLGGEEMWLDIDDALRFHARKVVALLSRAAVDPRKEGFRAELDRAHAYRKQLGDRRFIIPVRIDDVPHDQVPPTIGNRTIIDGQANHAAALARVIEILQKDGAARQATPSGNALLRWHQAFAPKDQKVEAETDHLISNWFPFASLPETIFFYEINRPLKNPITEPTTIAKEHPLPMAAYMRRLVAFAPWDAIQEPLAEYTPVKLERSMPLAVFMKGGHDELAVARDESRKILVSLLRQSFDCLAAQKGLKPYVLSARKTAWWIPDGLIPENKAQFTRASGLSGWRQLSGVYSRREWRAAGEYGRREWLWHFEINAVPMLGDPHRLRLTPHVIYTDPTGEKKPTAELRRAHCKLWFNSKWRDLLYGIVSYLADTNGQLVLPFGGDAHAIVASTPIGCLLPVRPSRVLEIGSGEKAEEGDAADLDISAYANDPAFTHLIEDDETGDIPAIDDGTQKDEDES